MCSCQRNRPRLWTCVTLQLRNVLQVFKLRHIWYSFIIINVLSYSLFMYPVKHIGQYSTVVVNPTRHPNELEDREPGVSVTMFSVEQNINGGVLARGGRWRSAAVDNGRARGGYQRRNHRKLVISYYRIQDYAKLCLLFPQINRCTLALSLVCYRCRVADDGSCFSFVPVGRLTADRTSVSDRACPLTSTAPCQPTRSLLMRSIFWKPIIFYLHSSRGRRAGRGGEVSGARDDHAAANCRHFIFKRLKYKLADEVELLKDRGNSSPRTMRWPRAVSMVRGRACVGRGAGRALVVGLADDVAEITTLMLSKVKNLGAKILFPEFGQ